MPIPLRPDFDAVGLRILAKKSKDAAQARRLLALAHIYDGGSRTQAGALGSVTLQIVRDWVMRFNADGPAGLIDRKAPGQPSRLNDEHRAASHRAVAREVIHRQASQRSSTIGQTSPASHRARRCRAPRARSASA